jgi:hypothetical protein
VERAPVSPKAARAVACAIAALALPHLAAFLDEQQTMASEPTLSIRQNPSNAYAAWLATATHGSHPRR